MWNKTLRVLKFTLLLTAVASILSGCAISFVPDALLNTQLGSVIPEKLEEITYTPVLFKAALLSSHSTETEVALDILDDITGLKHNVMRHTMQMTADNQYAVTVMLPLGGEVKYRYTSLFPLNETEMDAEGKPVVYRLASIRKGLVLDDKVAGWPSLPYEGETGTLTGIISDGETNQALPDILVSVAGFQTFTDMTGRFYLDNIPAGTHNLAAFSIDGSYRTYQQQASVASGLATPAPIKLDPLDEVVVTFVVTPPEDAIGAPIRIAGNLYQFGNIFNGMESGTSVLASRMPLMSRLQDGRYSFQIKLHSGNYLRYKYTLGDGFLNAEKDSQSNEVIRHLIIPNQDLTIENVVTTWRSGEISPVFIEVTVPDNTPENESVFIQFRFSEWLQPIPMWPMGFNKWMLLLFPNGSMDERVSYRICRNGLCDIASDPVSEMFPVDINLSTDQRSEYTVQNWKMWEPWDEPASVNLTYPENPNRLTGVEFSNIYNSSYQHRYREIISELEQLGINWLILTPTWKVEEINGLPHLRFVPGSSMFTLDIIEIVTLAQEEGLSVGLYPQLVFDGDIDSWWNQTKRSVLWWQQWYNEYERFILNFVQVAEKSNIDHFIVGGAGIIPSLPGSLQTTADNAGTPKNSGKIWGELIEKMTDYYQGDLLWVIPLKDSNIPAFDFYSSIDGFYLEVNSEPEDYPYYSETSVGRYLESSVHSFQDSFDLPVYFGLNAPSLSTANSYCSSSECVVSPTDQRYTGNDIDMNIQQYFYNTYYPLLSNLDWVNGISSRGFFPVVKLTDFSSSIFGKPSMDIIRYLNSQKQ